MVVALAACIHAVEDLERAVDEERGPYRRPEHCKDVLAGFFSLPPIPHQRSDEPESIDGATALSVGRLADSALIQRSVCCCLVWMVVHGSNRTLREVPQFPSRRPLGQQSRTTGGGQTGPSGSRPHLESLARCIRRTGFARSRPKCVASRVFSGCHQLPERA